ncbi:hypothetical protein B0T20DRAFT_390265 [Sordaria brevicollis]|uniref:MYND-type domain-containing protein n=1 Tax=Sordaria brevicollis TaxID=83679 RepID=A0AAE0PM13_SORBR|nr:hypothetical protein B0T20DRAFT_390265 [Sordaria brevicollis]
MYKKMFWHEYEDLSVAMGHLTLSDDNNVTDHGAVERKRNRKFYTPASFAAFLKFIKSRVQVDNWTATIGAVLGLVEGEPRRQPAQDDNKPQAVEYAEELKAWLHMLNVYTPAAWPASYNARNSVQSMDRLWQLRKWPNIPPVMCVTVVVPGKELMVVDKLERDSLSVGRLSYVECLIQSTPGDEKSCHRFAAVQLGYGTIKTPPEMGPGSRVRFQTLRPPGLEGNHDLMMSFMVPTSLLLHRDAKKAVVKIQFRQTPNVEHYRLRLGPELTIYETPLHNYDQVVITRYLPRLTGTPNVHEFPATPPPPDLQASTTIEGAIDNETDGITSMTAHIHFTSPELNTRLASGYKVHYRAISPCTYLITIKGALIERHYDNMPTTDTVEVDKLKETLSPSILIPEQMSELESSFLFSFPLLSDPTITPVDITVPKSSEDTTSNNNILSLTIITIAPESYRERIAFPSWVYPVYRPPLLPLSLPSSSSTGTESTDNTGTLILMPINYSLPYIPLDDLPIISLEKILKDPPAFPVTTDSAHASFDLYLVNHARTVTQREADMEEDCPPSGAMGSFFQDRMSPGELAHLHWKMVASGMILGIAAAGPESGRRRNVFGLCSKAPASSSVSASSEKQKGDEETWVLEMVFFVSCLRLDIANRCVLLDGAVLTRRSTNDEETGRLLDELKGMWNSKSELATTASCYSPQEAADTRAGTDEGSPSTHVPEHEDHDNHNYDNSMNSPIQDLYTTTEGLQLWKELLPAYVERCRTWEHDAQTCEYLLRPPHSLGTEPEVIICTCGNGRSIADNFCTGILPHVWQRLKKHLVRVAISPPFGCPFVEEPFVPGDLLPSPPPYNQPPYNQPPPPPPAAPSKKISKKVHVASKCKNCDRKKRKDGGELNVTCPVCEDREVMYCSRNCQREDSKRHKSPRGECHRGRGKGGEGW